MYFHVHHTMIHNDKAVPWEFGRYWVGVYLLLQYARSTSGCTVRLGVLYVWVYC